MPTWMPRRRPRSGSGTGRPPPLTQLGTDDPASLTEILHRHGCVLRIGVKTGPLTHLRMHGLRGGAWIVRLAQEGGTNKARLLWLASPR